MFKYQSVYEILITVYQFIILSVLPTWLKAFKMAVGTCHTFQNILCLGTNLQQYIVSNV